MNQEYAKLRSRPRNPDDAPSVEYNILPIVAWSDATLLALFGSAKLWPIYLYIANISKYIRGMPTEFVAQHVAYIPELPDELLDYYREVYKTSPTAETLRWLKSELMQRIWVKLLDDDFLKAYQHGVLTECADGVVRRLFPRFFTYSADYPEKALLTAIKNLGRCPCSRCLVKLKDIADSRSTADNIPKRTDTVAWRTKIKRTRKWLFTRGLTMTSKRIRDVLDARSLIPIQSAFSIRLGEVDPDFNVYDLLAPDFMHEFELGVWKGTFAHLIRLLHAQGPAAVQEFDRRMRLMPTFGRDTIRRFRKNVSRQSRVAARDFEDYLIVSIPAFEGLLPLRDNKTVLQLLFELVNWLSCAKLRLQTTVSLTIWRAATRFMYASVRKFARTTCRRYVTLELPQETLARARRAQAAQKSAKAVLKPPRRVVGPRVVKYNTWKTFKYHALGHHPSYVERSGTTDNHNTLVGELEHRHAKRVYARTNKFHFEKQIGIHQRRQALLRGIRAGLEVRAREHPGLADKHRKSLKGARATHSKSHSTTASRASHSRARATAAASIPRLADMGMRYDMGQSQRDPVDLYEWLADNDGDLALKDFLPSLRRHILARLTGKDENSIPAAWTNSLDIKDDRIYSHKVVRFNYPTYDMRRAQDSLNPRTHADIILLAEDDHTDDFPYWYARVVGVYHANVRFTGPGSTSRAWRRMDFLWVRWFAHDPTYSAGFQHRQIPRLAFVANDDPDLNAFGFVDPADVLRGAHIMPSFDSGTTDDYLPSDSVARQHSQDEDYVYYFVSMFVDRDMFMRHLGGGVGHRGIGVSLETSRLHGTRIEHPSESRRRNNRADSEPDSDETTESESESNHSTHSVVSYMDDAPDDPPPSASDSGAEDSDEHVEEDVITWDDTCHDRAQDEHQDWMIRRNLLTGGEALAAWHEDDADGWGADAEGEGSLAEGWDADADVAGSDADAAGSDADAAGSDADADGSDSDGEIDISWYARL
ncbi:hypothetical protein VTO73DRAFT_14510 [Trametes versicolor]